MVGARAEGEEPGERGVSYNLISRRLWAEREGLARTRSGS